jgi:hypothetical protein
MANYFDETEVEAWDIIQYHKIGLALTKRNPKSLLITSPLTNSSKLSVILLIKVQMTR